MPHIGDRALQRVVARSGQLVARCDRPHRAPPVHARPWRRHNLDTIQTALQRLRALHHIVLNTECGSHDICNVLRQLCQRRKEVVLVSGHRHIPGRDGQNLGRTPRSPHHDPQPRPSRCRHNQKGDAVVGCRHSILLGTAHRAGTHQHLVAYGHHLLDDDYRWSEMETSVQRSRHHHRARRCRICIS